MVVLIDPRVVRWISLAIILLLLFGCSKAVVIPRGQVASPEYREPGAYRIRLHGWNEYYARRFSVTDSTVVIEELLKTDDRYKRMKHDMPIVIPASEVISISEVRANQPITGILAVMAVIVVIGIIILGNMDLSID